MNILTPQQIAAAHSPAPVTVCAAAAGSGKTRTLVERINWLLAQQVAPANIVAITFTSAGAKVIQERAHTTQLGFAGTLHSLMLRLLKQHGHLIGLPNELSVMTETEADAMLLNIAGKLKVKESLRSLKNIVAMLLSDREWCAIVPAQTVANEFCRHMKQSGELSYDALLVLGLRLITEHPETAPWKHLCVDESQDSASIDWQIYRAIQAETKWFAGDHCQSIYGFRGAAVAEFMATARTAEVCPISVNYRSSLAVIAASNRLSESISKELHVQTAARTTAPAGAVTVTSYATATEEINAVGGLVMKAIAAQQTVAVLLRTNRAADIFRNALEAMGLPVAQVKPTGTAPDEKLGMAMLRAMNAPNNDRLLLKLVAEVEGTASASKLAARASREMTSVSALLNLPDLNDTVISEPEEALIIASRFYGNGTTKAAGFWLHNLAKQVPLPATLGDLLLEAQRKPEEDAPDERLHVGTIHSSKGREWNVVVLPAFEDETIPGNAEGEEMNEMRRLAYVAVTRAKEAVHISHAASRPDDYAKWKMNTRTLSRFAKELQ